MYTLMTFLAMVVTSLVVVLFANAATATAIGSHFLNRLFWQSALVLALYFDISGAVAYYSELYEPTLIEKFTGFFADKFSNLFS